MLPVKIYRPTRTHERSIVRTQMNPGERPLVSIPFEFDGQIYTEVLFTNWLQTVKGMTYLSEEQLATGTAPDLIDQLEPVWWLYNLSYLGQDLGTRLLKERSDEGMRYLHWHTMALRYMRDQGCGEAQALSDILQELHARENDQYHLWAEQVELVEKELSRNGYLGTCLLEQLSSADRVHAYEIHRLYSEASALWQVIMPLARSRSSMWLRLCRPYVGQALHTFVVCESTYDPRVFEKLSSDEYHDRRRQAHREHRMRLLRGTS